jgi:hypothetical protein
MKKLLLTSLLMLCASLAYAGSGCGGGGCDSDKKDGKADSTQSNAVLAGGCGDKSDDKKDGKSDFTVRQSAIV